MDSGEQRSATPGMKTRLATQTAQRDQFRTRIAMTAAVQLVAVPLLADRHRRVERSAMRDPTTARGCRTRPLTLGFGNAKLEEAAVLREEQVTRLQALVCPILSWKCTSNIF